MTTALPPARMNQQRANPPGPGHHPIDDRREHLRRMLRVPLRLAHPHQDNAVQLIDICRSGVAFASTAPLELGSTIVLSLQLPTAPGTATVSGDVVYCRQMPQSGLYKVGVRLYHVSELTVESIVDFVTAPYIA